MAAGEVPVSLDSGSEQVEEAVNLRCGLRIDTETHRTGPCGGPTPDPTSSVPNASRHLPVAGRQ